MLGPQPVYNESMPKGGNPLEVDVNAQYVGYEYNYVYIAFCAFIVFFILPGLGESPWSSSLHAGSPGQWAHTAPSC